jgi:hypothetical protein
MAQADVCTALKKSHVISTTNPALLVAIQKLIVQ